MTKSNKPLVVVDADTLVFRSAAVSEERLVEVEHLPSGRKKIYKNRTTFKEAMKEKNFEVKPEDFKFSDIQEEQPIANCLHTIKMQAQNIVDRFSDSEIIWCCGDKNNFRLELPLPVQYKSNRNSMIRPIHLSKAKEYFCDKFKAKSAEGMEVDDLVLVLSYEARNVYKRDVTLASVDKDSKQAIGLKLFDYVNPEYPIIEVKDWHPVELNAKKEFKSYGVPWLCMQWINGDLSDGFSAKQLAGIKIGDVGLYEMFKDCKYPKDNLEIVINWFKESFGDNFAYTDWQGNIVNTDWKDIMQLYYKCCKMKTSYEDKLDCFELFDTCGVKL